MSKVYILRRWPTLELIMYNLIIALQEVWVPRIFCGTVAIDEMWSTGAYNARSVTIDRDETIRNKLIKADKYALFTIPGKKTWTIILNTNWDQHHADEYSESEDVLRFEVEPCYSE